MQRGMLAQLAARLRERQLAVAAAGGGEGEGEIETITLDEDCDVCISVLIAHRSSLFRFPITPPLNPAIIPYLVQSRICADMISPSRQVM